MSNLVVILLLLLALLFPIIYLTLLLSIPLIWVSPGGGSLWIWVEKGARLLAWTLLTHVPLAPSHFFFRCFMYFACCCVTFGFVLQIDTNKILSFLLSLPLEWTSKINALFFNPNHSAFLSRRIRSTSLGKDLKSKAHTGCVLTSSMPVSGHLSLLPCSLTFSLWSPLGRSGSSSPDLRVARHSPAPHAPLHANLSASVCSFWFRPIACELWRQTDGNRSVQYFHSLAEYPWSQFLTFSKSLDCLSVGWRGEYLPHKFIVKIKWSYLFKASGSVLCLRRNISKDSNVWIGSEWIDAKREESVLCWDRVHWGPFGVILETYLKLSHKNLPQGLSPLLCGNLNDRSAAKILAWCLEHSRCSRDGSSLLSHSLQKE